ncbi:MAG: MATE family efflux transporter [Firmicutes bacterium]|nr:MATE family efflux transporter [Bacillota bacterium]
MVSTTQLEKSNVFSLLLKFSGPAIAGMLVVSVYNLVDRFYIGRSVGMLGMAGITVGYPLMMVKGAIALLLGIGGGAVVSILLGEKKRDEAERVMGTAVMMMIISSLALTIISLLFLRPLMKLFGASDTVLPYAMDYMRVIVCGNLFHFIGFGLTYYIRAEGNPRTAMFATIIGAVMNIILDPIFIYIFEMGVAGAALATIISQAITAVWVLLYYKRGKSFLKLRPNYLRVEIPFAKRIVSTGAASFLKQIAQSLIMIIFNNSLLYYGGDVAVSAMGVIFSVASLLNQPIYGISQGAQPIIGYNFGAQLYGRVKKALFMAIALATAYMTFAYIVIMFFPRAVLGFFTTEAELIAVGTEGIRIYMLFLPIIGFQIIGASYFQTVGRAKHAVFQNLTRQVLFLIPALLILPRFLQLKGVWAAQAVADGLSVLVTGYFVWREVRQLDRKEAELLARHEL